MSTKQRQCTHVKDDGERCQAAALRKATDERCIWHTTDPDLKDKATNARRRGGVNNARTRARFLLDSEAPAVPKTIDDLCQWSFFLVHAIATGRIDPRTSDSVTRAIKVAMDAGEGSELRTRLAELEATIAEVRRTGVRLT